MGLNVPAGNRVSIEHRQRNRFLVDDGHEVPCDLPRSLGVFGGVRSTQPAAPAGQGAI